MAGTARTLHHIFVHTTQHYRILEILTVPKHLRPHHPEKNFISNLKQKAAKYLYRRLQTFNIGSQQRMEIGHPNIHVVLEEFRQILEV